MVLYGEINRKGFEGDLVLNGYAEFIRNLLVCKDEKAAGLLEVVENFRDKYISAAKNVSPAFLISALNILNDAELAYKAARNKRLHVELALIKLCYLQQALQLTADGGQLGKKKIVDEARAVSFKAIQPIVVKGSREEKEKVVPKPSQEPKLIIETPAPKPTPTVREEKPAYTNNVAAAPAQNVATETMPAPAKGKLSSLDAIRQK